MSNPIVVENALPGTNAWQITNGALNEIQAYADKTSLDPGQSINFFVSTQNAGTLYSLDIYRLGWYQSLGGNLKFSTSGLVGQNQGNWDDIHQTLVGDAGAIIDSATHNFDCNWTSSTSWTVPGNAVTGAYVAKFTDANNRQWGVSFIVRGNSTADYGYVHSFCTDIAYNDWGGHSLYSNVTVDTKDSFNRPVVDKNGYGSIVGYELPCIRWLEMQGYNLSYLSDIDVHVNGAAILQTYKAVLHPGHSEYWTKEMYNASQTALATGVGLGVLGANACYWQCRLENDNAGNSNRTLVCYKVRTGFNNYSLDPLYGVDNTKVTTNWRDPLLNRPENVMIGIMWGGYNAGGTASNVTWTVDPAATSSFLVGTGLVAGNSYGSDIVGSEWDSVHAGGPSNLQIVATSATFSNETNAADIGNTTAYIASSSALVFAAGSICWTWCLDSYRSPTKRVNPVPGMQQLFTNIMKGLIKAKSTDAIPTGFSAFSAHR